MCDSHYPPLSISPRKMLPPECKGLDLPGASSSLLRAELLLAKLPRCPVLCQLHKETKPGVT